MPTLSHHKSNDFVKAFVIGRSKAGKTGGLVSLVEAGYKLGILDMDNLLDSLKYQILNRCPDKIENVNFLTFRDKRKASPQGPVIDGKPTAFVNALKALDNWPDLGKPAEWGPDWILVVDTLSRLCDAGFDFYEAMMHAQGTKYDGRMVYYNTQKAIEDILMNLGGENFGTNVLILCHIMYITQPDGTVAGYPQSVGQALSPKVAQFLPSAFLVTNKGGKRVVQTNSDPLIDLANPAPFKMSPQYPLETGFADFFAVLREPPKASTSKPAKATIRRLA